MPFRRVIDSKAGPLALGILAPPAPRTLLILRPRELPWDLVLTTTSGHADFTLLSRPEAALQAQRVFRLLEAQSVGFQNHPLEDGFRLVVKIGDFPLLLCDRIPGQPYAPSLLAEADHGRAVTRLQAILLPGDLEQEVYFNTIHFEAA